MTDQRTSSGMFFVLLAFGLLANIRAVVIVQLIGTGMCLGGALVVALRSPRQS